MMKKPSSYEESDGLCCHMFRYNAPKLKSCISLTVFGTGPWNVEVCFVSHRIFPAVAFEARLF